MLLAASTLAVALTPLGVQAQSMPSYARPIPQQEVIKGTITGFDGKYTVYVHDVRGYVDHVELHDGTVINPTGLRLQEGMRVTIYGYPNGGTFSANVVNTPYPPGYAYYQNGPYWYGPGWGWYGGWYGGGWGYYRPWGWR